MRYKYIRYSVRHFTVKKPTSAVCEHTVPKPSQWMLWGSRGQSQSNRPEKDQGGSRKASKWTYNSDVTISQVKNELSFSTPSSGMIADLLWQLRQILVVLCPFSLYLFHGFHVRLNVYKEWVRWIQSSITVDTILYCYLFHGLVRFLEILLRKSNQTKSCKFNITINQYCLLICNIVRYCLIHPELKGLNTSV